MTVNATPRPTYEVAALARHAPVDPAVGPEARTLFPLPVLDRARIPPTARVLMVGRRPVTSGAQAQRILRTARQPIPVLVSTQTTRFFAAIEPSR